MRIWLATVGEPLPNDGPSVRLLRTGQFAQWLSDHGHEVVFWTGTMDHYGRRLRSDQTTVVEQGPGYRIVMLEGRLYKRTISYSRFMNHVDVAAAFAKIAPTWPPPDIIFTSFPTLELSRAMADYAEQRDIPFVIDVRDFWPDIFAEALPKPLRPLAPFVFGSFERSVRTLFARADGLAGMTPSALDWTLAKAGRKARIGDFSHNFTYSAETRSAAAVAQTVMPEPDQVDERPETTKFCFIGTHSHRVNLEVFVSSFLKLEAEGVPASLMLCGRGEVTDELKRMAHGSRSVLFPGWLNAGQIQKVLSLSDIGVLPYNQPDFRMSIPNKVAEYLHGGLAVLSCTEGEVRNLLETRRCGFWCEPNELDIVRSVKDIVARPEAVSEARQNGRKVYKAEFDRDTVFGRVLENLRLVAKARQPSV